MDEIKFPSIESTKMVVVLFLTANGSAAMETTNGPPFAVVSSPPKPEPIIKSDMAILLACVLTASLLACFLFFYFRRYTDRQLALAATTRSRGGERSSLKLAAAGLDPAVIETFTTFTYSAVKEVKIGQQVLECAVCLNEFYDHDILRLLPECCHVFHRDCIDEWLVLRVTCPVCRANLVPKPGRLSKETKSTGFNENEQTNDHVVLDVIKLNHPSGRMLLRSYSVGHSATTGRPVENVERYSLRLPHQLKNVISLEESSLKKCLRSASASYIRETNYFSYERFARERS